MEQKMDDLLNTFTEVRECDYKGEHYSVRDNGAIMRHPKPGKRPRAMDNTWTFGRRDDKTAYMLWGSHRIHIIVAMAFLGERDSRVYVVDHIDTNRCNNRVGNLRWFTRLENALNNPITRKRIEWLCGGDIQKFIDDPSCLRTDDPKAQDLSWMRTVSPDEAKTAISNLIRWAKRPLSTSADGDTKGETKKRDTEWMFKKRDKSSPMNQTDDASTSSRETDDEVMTSRSAYKRSIKFLQEPEASAHPSLEDYFSRLRPGMPFAETNYGISSVIETKMAKDGSSFGVAVTFPSEIKRYAAYRVMVLGNLYAYEFLHTCFEKNGALQRMTEAAGEKWDGPDSIDNYC